MSSSRSHNTSPQKTPPETLSRSSSIIAAFFGYIAPAAGKRNSGERPDRSDDNTPSVETDAGSLSKRMKVDNSHSTVAKSSPEHRRDVKIPKHIGKEPSNRRTLSPRPVAYDRRLSRTMSMDPPSFNPNASAVAAAADLPNRPTPTREITMREPSLRGSLPPAPYLRSSVSLGHDMPMRDSSTRDASLPPTVRPTPLRMRMSVTPQPGNFTFGPAPGLRREHSYMSVTPQPEDPPFGPAVSNIVPEESDVTAFPADEQAFVRAPSTTPQSPEQRVVTLGELAQAQQRKPPPFLPQNLTHTSAAVSAPSFVSKYGGKLAKGLDVYKTPYMPTRLRDSSSVDSEIIPAIVRSGFTEENAPLLIEKRKRASRLGSPKKPKSSRRDREKDTDRETTNEGKPYAGRGGLKRFLTRRKDELSEPNREQSKESKSTSDVAMPAETESARRAPSPPARAAPPTSPSKVTTPAGGIQQSSLRVGRARLRDNRAKPIARPASKNKFSAAIDDDDDSTVDEEAARERDRKELEEAAKHVPVFSIPADFSFLKEGPLVQHDLSKAKEPPIASLPFSFTKPTVTSGSQSPSPAPQTAEQAGSTPAPAESPAIPSPAPATFLSAFSPAPKPAKAAVSFAPATPAPTTPAPTTPAPATPAPEPPKAAQEPAEPNVASSASSPAGSNFFAKSALSAPAPPAPAFSFAPTPKPVIPITDAENPLWEGDKRTTNQGQDQPQALLPSLFVDPSKAAPAQQNSFGVLKTSTVPAAPPSLFGGSAPAAPSSLFGGSVTATSSSGTSLFDGSARSDTATKSNPTSIFGSAPSDTATKSSAIFGAAPSTASSSGISLFGSSTAPSSTAPSLFGTAPASTAPSLTGPSLFGAAAPSSTGPLFGTRSGAATPIPEQVPIKGAAAAVETAPSASSTFPTSLFGRTDAPTTSAAPVASNTFTFGVSSTTPDVAPSSRPQSQTAAAPAEAPNTVPMFSTSSFSGFGATAAVPLSTTPSEPPKVSTFPFGRTQSSAPVAPVFGAPAPAPVPEAPALGAPKSLFGSGGNGFSFAPAPALVARPAAVISEANEPSKTGFSFGAAASAPPAAPEKKPAFTFGVAPPTSASGFPYSVGGSNAADVSRGPFVFGSAANLSRPVTPPKNPDLEFRMEDSPARDMQNGMKSANKINGFGDVFSTDMSDSPSAPPAQSVLGAGGFGGARDIFGGTKLGGGSMFDTSKVGDGAMFGTAKSGSGSMFGSAKPESGSMFDTAKSASGSMFGQSAAATSGFSFNPAPKPPPIDTSRPSVPPVFQFNAPTPTTVTPTASGNPFSFSNTTTPTTQTPPTFGYQAGASPASPSSFSTPAPTAPASNAFLFGSTTGTSPAPFSFGAGSQPSSPANAGSSLPPTGGAGFGFGSGTGTQGSSPFSAPVPAAAPLFTIGSAPPPPPPGQRQMRKLPARRGGKR